MKIKIGRVTFLQLSLQVKEIHEKKTAAKNLVFPTPDILTLIYKLLLLILIIKYYNEENIYRI